MDAADAAAGAPSAPSEAPSPPPASPPPSPKDPKVERARRDLVSRARMSAFLVLGLLIVTAAAYTAYTATGLEDAKKVFSHILTANNTTSSSTTGTSGTTTTAAPANATNTSATPLGSFPVTPYAGFLDVSALTDLALVWVMVGFTALSILRPSALKNPAKLLDVFYLTMLFGLVFWPVAAIGAFLGNIASVGMLGLGLVPALVLTIFVGRFVEEGTGSKVLFVVILGAVALLMLANTILWGAFLSGGELYLVGILQIVPVGLFLGRALYDKTEPIRTRPLVGELLLWSSVGLVLACAIGIVVSGNFNAAGTELIVVTSMFSGTTYIISPFASSTFVSLTGATAFYATNLPVLFGILGVMSALLSLAPILWVGDLMMLRSGLESFETCPKCGRIFLSSAGRTSPACNRCRGLAVGRQRPTRAGPGPSQP